MKNVVQSLVSLSFALTPALALPKQNGFAITDLLDKDITVKEYAHEVGASPHLTKRQYNGDTFNQLTDGSACRDISVIFARGTTSPGNVGEAGSEGPSFFNALASRLGGTSRLAIQGVNYPASIIGFLQGGDPAGGPTMLNLVKNTASRCPNTKIILSGYSQGGQIVHNAAQQMTAATAARVTAVVTFGDADRDEDFGPIPLSKTKIICHSGDNICDNGIFILPAHLDYEKDAPAAAAFVISKL